MGGWSGLSLSGAQRHGFKRKGEKKHIRTNPLGQGGEGQEHGEGGEEEVQVEAGVEAEDGAQPEEVHHAGEARGEENVHWWGWFGV